jgi:hypothetical protein
MAKKIIYIPLFIIGLIISAECLIRLFISIKILPFVAGQAELLSSYQIMPMFNHPVSRYDELTGFRWIPGQHQTLKICQGKTIFYNDFKVNNSGFVSGFNYKKERNGTKKRYLVLGDSFTDGYYLKENWPSHCNRLIRNENLDLELYNYALNGNGLTAWHRIYKQWIADSMAFDGLIIAVFANDLQRDLFVWTSGKSQSCFGWKAPNSLLLDSFAHLPCISNIKPAKGLQQLLFEMNDGPKSLWESGLLLPFYAKATLHMISGSMEFKTEQRKLSEKFIWNEKFSAQQLSEKYFIEKYGSEKAEMLFSMLEDLRKNNKEVILASVPDQYGLKLSRSGKRTIPSAELQFLSRKFGTRFLDGYQWLAEQGKPEDFFLPMDGHWNQKGSDYFAEGIFGILTSSIHIHENPDSLRR